MASEPVQRDSYRQYLYNTVLVKRTRLQVRNEERRMWSLVAKRDIRVGEFIGIYTGSYASRTCPAGSHYALDMGASQPCIVPFANEAQITPSERETHPLACMNEPSADEVANCHMAIQDFTQAEIANVESILHHEQSRFFRCLCCFACEDIQSGEALTWNYGPAYAPIRKLIGYAAGSPCRRVLADEVFIKPDSRAVLETLGRVPHYAVWQILLTQTIKSGRFKMKHARHTADSEGEQSESFSSGSDLEEAYKPRPSARRRDEAGPST